MVPLVVDEDTVLEDEDEVEVMLNGACWETFIFVMLRDMEAEGPVYCHRIGLSPHVYISPRPTKSKVGLALAETELLVLDAGVAVVGVLVTDPATLMVGDAVEEERERPNGLTGGAAGKTA